MGQVTTIEWTDASSNPLRYRDHTGREVWACVKVSPGCAHCYAESMAIRFKRGGKFTRERMDGKLTPFISDNEVNRLLRDKKIAGKRVFLCDMTDLFGDWVSDDLLNRLFSSVLEIRTDVTFQILTKRADRMREYLSWRWGEGRIPARNIWLGVSVENQAAAAERIPLLLKTPAAVRFLSCEPLLEGVDLGAVGKTADGWPAINALTGERRKEQGPTTRVNDGPRVDWVIVGGESGHGARPCDVAWVRSIVEQCDAADVPVFVKQLGSNVVAANDEVSDWFDRCGHLEQQPTASRQGAVGRVFGFRDRKGGEMAEWPEDIRVRQFPEARS